MMKAIETAFDIARQKAFEQSQRMQSELSAAADALMVAKVQFENDMKAASATAKTSTEMRANAVAAYEKSLQEAARVSEDAEAQRNEAVRVFDSAMTQLSALLMALQRQIGDGEIVTGITGGEPKRPKLVKAAAHE